MMHCVITECTNNFNSFQVSAQDFLAAKSNGNLAEKGIVVCTAKQQSIKKTTFLNRNTSNSE